MFRAQARTAGWLAIAVLALAGPASAMPDPGTAGASADPEPALEAVQQWTECLEARGAACVTDPDETQRSAEREAEEAQDEAQHQQTSGTQALDQAVEQAEATLDEVTSDLGIILSDVQRQAETVTQQVQDVLAGPDGDEEPEELEPVAATYRPAGQSLTPVLWVAGATAGAAALWFIGTSGILSTTGASAAQGGMTSAAKRYGIAAPLFTRFARDTVLKHPNREELYRLVSENPGIRLQDLCDSTGLSRTAVTHHLRLMEQQHMIVSKRVGRSRHFYENGGRYERDQKEAYAVLQNDRSREIARHIRDNPGVIQKHLCEALGIRASIVHWHVQRLQEAQLVDCERQGRTVSYFPGTPLSNVSLN